MDDRRRFLYCRAAEMRGRTRGGGSRERRARPKRSGRGAGKRAPHAMARRGPKESREAREARAEKSRYGLHGTRTANRHRWMRRGS